MSIASRITSIEGHIENDYNALERLGADLTGIDKNIENIASVVNNIYDKLPKVTGTGSSISLTPTLKGGMNILPLGNCEQTGTPTPDNPIDVKVVTGDNQVVIGNKNIFDGIFESGTLNDGVPVTDNQCIRSKNFINVQPNTTYTLSADNNISLFVAYYDVSKNWLSNNNVQNTPKTITTPNNCYYIKIRTRQSENITDLNTKAQIEVGSTATSYVAHQEQSYTLHLGNEYLASIPNTDYKDEINVVNKKIIRKVGKVVFNLQNLPVDASSGLTNCYRFNKLNIQNFLPINAENTGLSNILNRILGNYGMDIESYFLIAGQLTFKINKTTLDIYSGDTSLQKLENYITDKGNIIFYYRLETPTEETITDTSLINELNGLQELLSYDGTTNITITSDSNNAQMLVQVSALKGG